MTTISTARGAAHWLSPADSDYGRHTATFNLAVTHRPDAVVAARSTADIAAAVRYAADNGLGVAVHATGHGAVAPVEGGVMVSTRDMQGVRIDPRAGTATIEAGVKWRAVIDAAAAHRLAPLNGSSSDVGAIGYTVGGGLPVLGRTFGFCADHVKQMTVVTADGAIRDVTAQTEPDLFWGLRGGKGNLGIVTEMTVGLVPVSRIYGGGIYYSGGAAAEVLHAYREWTATLDDRTSSAIALLRLPPFPEIPELLRGTCTVHLRVAHVGDDGHDVLAPMRAVAPALIDAVGDLPYTSVDLVYQDPDHPVPAYERSELLRTVDADVINRLLDVAGPQVRTPLLFAELRHLGGALAREPESANAVTGRDAEFLLFALGMLAPDIAAAVPAAVDGVVDALSPCTTGNTMVNLHGRPGDRDDRARAWTPETYRRLRALKAGYDPGNLFRYGHALLP